MSRDFTMDERTLAQIFEAGEVEVVIDDYGYKGEGYVRLDDGWLSVPGALPGERVRVRVEDSDTRRGRRIYGTLVDVLTASPKRRDPLCERDSICRGCQLRHATIDEELRFHVRTVEEVVEKFAGLSAGERPEVELITPQPTSRGDAFRIRSTLTYRRLGGHCELGLVSPVSDSLVPMDVCPALTTPVRRLVSTVQEAFAALDELPPDASDDADGAPTLTRVHIASPVIGRGLVDLEVDGAGDREALERLTQKGPLAALIAALRERLTEGVGLAMHDSDSRLQLGGPERIRLPLAGLRLWVGHDDWFPATLTPTDAVYDRLLDLLELDDEDRFLDIGSGIGTISLLAAPRVEHVVGVDINRRSISTAELNAVENELTNVEFVVGGWENALRKLTLDEHAFSVATINPMREPLGKRPLTYLEPLGVERLVYLGPSPAAAAKDLGELQKMGWTLDRLFAANIHPATYHTMLVARLVRR